MRGLRLSDLADDGVIGIGIRQHVEHLGFDCLGLLHAPQLAVLAGEPRLNAKPTEGPY